MLCLCGGFFELPCSGLGVRLAGLDSLGLHSLVRHGRCLCLDAIGTGVLGGLSGTTLPFKSSPNLNHFQGGWNERLDTLLFRFLAVYEARTTTTVTTGQLPLILGRRSAPRSASTAA